jgi:hypothetical protein
MEKMMTKLVRLVMLVVCYAPPARMLTAYENKDGKPDDEDSDAGDAGGVLRASGADAGGLENK